MLGLIVDDSLDPARNLALDEALARVAPASGVLRLWQNPSCVVVGRFQRVEREADLAACARDRVPVLRRASGGGTVYQDDGNLNVTLVLPEPARRDPLRALRALLVDAVARLGLPADDRVDGAEGSAVASTGRGVFVRGAKLSGLAALRTAHASLAHATLLVHTPGRRVTAYLTPAPAVPHPLDSHRAPVASLAEHGLRVGLEEVRAAVLAAAQAALGPVRPRDPDPAERSRLDALLTARYTDPTWHLTGRENGERKGTWTAGAWRMGCHASNPAARRC